MWTSTGSPVTAGSGCERTGVPVIWLGPLQWDGRPAPVYSCKPCLDRLKARALAYFMQRRPVAV
ncbi:predicted protein [Streptomyces viridochromogenes DSM 40736]|uniref:Predicted protein n=1 Tax=Streptomyces viridochromogenes (strain DSM 40736 / JCM 4977 / BCRC 1201 / Tue 494) TaxID=591159 RepID=D9X6W1_STRVT|nr:predicted protein [Streptomyces viridochromogenes DSM 40736]